MLALNTLKQVKKDLVTELFDVEANKIINNNISLEIQDVVAVKFKHTIHEQFK